MNKKSRGFTLIELLVVVLIIGILAAIALPQYEKAVERARMAQAVIMVKKVAEAQERFKLVNGRWATFEEKDALDVSFPSGSTFAHNGQNRPALKDFFCTNQGAQSGEVNCQRKPGDKYYIYILPSAPSVLHCFAYANATNIEKKLCSEMDSKGML